MSTLDASDLRLPVKRTDGDALEERLTANAYHNILPARYLRKDANGDLVEDPEDLFPRVAKNIALAEAAFAAEERDDAITVRPDQVKPDHPRRDELAAEAFGAGTTVDDDVSRPLTPENVNKFAYDTVVPELPDEVRERVEEARAEFEELMSRLSFMPNSPTLMNAGDELQQLSACFVDSPEDDIDDIHETAKEAAQVFQCLTAGTRVFVDGKGVVSIADVEPGDEIRQRDGDGHCTRTVGETHAYHDAPVRRVETEAGVELTGTPNHELLVDDEWTRIDEIEPGDTLSVRLDWLPDTDETVELATVAEGGQWSAARTVSNGEILELYAEGLSDHEIAGELDCSASTVQRRRANELGLDPNGSGGRDRGDVSFDVDSFDDLYEAGRTDGEIAAELGVSRASVGQHRATRSLEPNGDPAKTVAQPATLTPDLAELLGMWVGDGSKHEDGIRFHLARDENLDHADRLCRRLFDEGLDWRFEDGCYDAVLHSHEIRRFWLANFGDAKPDAPSARVPEPVRSADRETVAAFLRGLFSTDGSLQKDRYPRLWSASTELIEDVQQLLLGLGIPATTWEMDSADRDYYNVGPTGERGLTRYADLVGFTDGRADEMADDLDGADLRDTSVGTIRGDTAWEVPVAAVEDAGTEVVYDVTVTGNHEYVADSVVSHNSGGGMGYAFWRLRPYGDAVGSTGGIASGPITFMRTYDQMCETIAQGGARRGAQMAVMRVSHPDVIQFIHAKNKDVSLAHSLRLNDPDDYTHTSFADALEEARELIDEDGKVPKHLRNAVEGHLSNFNISVGVTDEFMDALENGEEFTFTNPRTGEAHVATPETKELYDMHGLGEHVEVGEELSIPAQELWDDMVEGAHENGEPGVIYLERVNEEHSFDVEEHPDHRILATNPSLAAGTRVLTDRGVVPIEDLENRRVEVPTLSDEWADARCHRSGDDEPIYEVELSNGKTYRATEEHKWPVRQGDGSYERTKTTEIDPGSKLPIGRRQSLQYGSVGSHDEGFLVGWLYGDGSVTHRKDGRSQYEFTFSEEDATAGAMDRVLDTLEEITGVEYSPTERQRDGEPWYEVHASHAALRRRMDKYGIEKKESGVPEIVWSDASESFRKGFVDGLFSADGHVDPEQNRIILVSAKEELITDISDLLGFYGLKSSLRSSEVERWDETYDRWDLKLSRTAAHRFGETFDLTHERKSAALADLKPPDRDNVLSDNVVVEAVRETDDSGPVWDLRVAEETHTFALSHAFTGNCGEQPLEEYEACNLGHINLSTLAAEDSPDWRVWSERHAGEYDTEAAAVEAFLEEAVDWEAFDHRIEWGTRFLENVVTMSDFPVPEIEEKVRRMRKIGLGVMGLAQLYVQLGMQYGSDTSNEVARQLMRHINHGSKATSHDLAEERGVFADWADSKYADPVRYREWFEHQTGESADDWAEGYPIRNHNTTTIAPTGTTSMIGNTTGGCEPIYNVAYYKNVSDDVQGDEMLVEFDDYFLRTLEANDLDVDAVKREAQEQMAENEFDGVEGLTTVPDAISELFVVTGDLSGKQHAAVQCACQEGVDSAISKTCNFPNSATPEDMDEVYRYIYEHGGKGVTVYRDGTRSKQVLTTRAENTEFADEGEAAEALVAQIEEVFGGIDEFLDHEDVRASVDAEVERLLAAADGETPVGKKRPRPDVLRGVTQRIDTGYGKLYVNINEDPEGGRPFELFANIGNSGGFTASFTEALAKTISTALRSGVDPREIADELQGIRSPKVAWDKGEQINSIPDAIGTALRRYLDGEVDKAYPQQQTIDEVSDEERRTRTADTPEPDGGATVASGGADAETETGADVLDAGENPECPDCGSLSLYYSEGCKTCESCGWSEC